MTVTLNFKPDVEAGLLAQAQASGMTVEEYLLSMVEGAVAPARMAFSSAPRTSPNSGTSLLARRHARIGSPQRQRPTG